VQQKDDYYPFALEINRSVLSPKNEYLYNKKELQEKLDFRIFSLFLMPQFLDLKQHVPKGMMEHLERVNFLEVLFFEENPVFCGFCSNWNGLERFGTPVGKRKRGRERLTFLRLGERCIAGRRGSHSLGQS
jgi:hypothetical protein